MNQNFTPIECNIEREAETNKLLRNKTRKSMSIEETPKEPKEKTMELK